MKKSLLVLLFAVATIAGYAQVAINTDGSSANASAMLDVKSDTAGILIPRMTAAQRDAINNPAQGLMVFVTDDSTFYYYKKTSWLQFSSGENGWTVNGDTVYNVSDQVVIGTNTPQSDANLTVYKSTVSSELSTNLFSYLSNGGSGAGYVTYNKIINYGSGQGACVFNDITSNSTSPQSGVYNYFKVNAGGSGSLIGSHTSIFSHGSGNHIGVYNGLHESGDGDQYGCDNVIDNSGTGNHYGTYNSLTGGSGSGKHYGTYNFLSNYNNGNKYGSYNYIESSAGGKHYGIYSRAEGNANYAGYFLGRMYMSDSVGIGVDSATALLDVNGTFRLRDGSESDGYILKSDANGNAGWIDASTITNTLDEAYDQGGAGAGKNITADAGAVRVDGTDGLLVTGTYDSGNSIDNEVTGSGTRMFFYPKKAAFRAGSVDSNHWDDDSIGSNSVAMGYNTKAISMRSTAFGNGTRAYGASSTALGSQTVALGNGSTTTGTYSVAKGRGSTAMGWGTYAYSFDEMVLGSYNTVYSPTGIDSWNTADRLFVIGNGADETSKHNALTIYKDGRMNINDEYFMPQTDGTAGQIMQTDGAGQVSFVDAGTIGNTLDNAYDQGGAGAGKSITADAGAVRVDGTDGLIVTGSNTWGNSIDSEVTGSGTRMFFYPKKSAFRAGFVNSNQWDDANIGYHSVATGYGTIASGATSTALGFQARAVGDYSTAIGDYSRSSGQHSIAMGRWVTAPSYNETTIGSYNTDYFPASALSWDESDRLFTIGNGQDEYNKSDALIVYKNGKSNFNGMVRVDGTDGFLVTGTHASGNSIDAEVTGSGTRMFYNPYKAAFRVGYVSGTQWDDANIGNYSVAMGGNTTASGYTSTAMGISSTASGYASTAMGYYTTAPSYRETVMGSYNTDYAPAGTDTWDASDRLFVVGNGQSVSSKSDALIIYKNGNTELHKKLTAPLSGNADMKAYIYGYLSGASGSVSIDASKSSSGFTVARVVAGKYRVTFTESGISNYILTANVIASATPRFVTYVINAGSNNFDIYVWKLDGTLMDSDVSFVVYKK